VHTLESPKRKAAVYWKGLDESEGATKTPSFHSPGIVSTSLILLFCSSHFVAGEYYISAFFCLSSQFVSTIGRASLSYIECITIQIEVVYPRRFFISLECSTRRGFDVFFRAHIHWFGPLLGAGADIRVKHFAAVGASFG